MGKYSLRRKDSGSWILFVGPMSSTNIQVRDLTGELEWTGIKPRQILKPMKIYLQVICFIFAAQQNCWKQHFNKRKQWTSLTWCYDCCQWKSWRFYEGLLKLYEYCFGYCLLPGLCFINVTFREIDPLASSMCKGKLGMVIPSCTELSSMNSLSPDDRSEPPSF